MRRCALFLFSLSLLLAGSSGCSSCGEASTGVAAEAGVAAVEPPVPAPAGLLAEAWVRAPDAAWARIQRGVSGAVALLPPTVGELACGFAGLDPHLAQLVDGKATSYAVLGEGGAGGSLAWVLALPLTDAGAPAAMLLEASDGGPGPAGAREGGPEHAARYVARDVGGMRVLTSRGDRSLSVPVALAGRWLLLASREDDLASLGPYAYRTMPTRPPPPGTATVVATVPQKTLAGAVASRLAARWDEQRAWLVARDDEQRAKHGGRAPDFGDPRAIIEALDAFAKRKIALVAQGRGARLEIDPGEEDVHADLFVTPGEGEGGAVGLSAMHTGDASPLAQLPADAVVGLLGRDDAASRSDDARELEAALDRALGERARGDDGRAIHAAVDDWARARGDWWTTALAWGAGDAGRGLWARTPARDADASVRAVRELVDLSHRRAFGDLLTGSLRLLPASFGTADVPSFGKASLATFPWAPHDGGARTGKPDAAPPPPAVAWGVHEGDLLLAAGFAAPQLLAAEAAPPRRVGDDARSARALAAIGSDATFAVFAQPLRFDAARSGGDAASAPAVVAWGRKGTEGWLRIELADVLLRELLRLQAGL